MNTWMISFKASSTSHKKFTLLTFYTSFGAILYLIGWKRISYTHWPIKHWKGCPPCLFGYNTPICKINFFFFFFSFLMNRLNHIYKNNSKNKKKKAENSSWIGALISSVISNTLDFISISSLWETKKVNKSVNFYVYNAINQATTNFFSA